MGKKKAWGGAAQIDRAEEFFRATGEYKYVALAIGSRPFNPPQWAIWACVELRLKSETHSALGRSTKYIDAILDQTIVFLAKHQTDSFKRCQDLDGLAARADCHSQFKPLPLERAFKLAIQLVDPELAGTSGNQWFSALDNLKKAWRREQQEELVDWELAGLENDGPALEGYRTTHRIDRVLMKYHASEYPEDSPHFYDPELLLWIAENVSDR